MKKTLTLTLFLLISFVLYSQTGWVEVQSGSTANLQSVDWASTTVVWAVGDNGVVLRSTNAGQAWTAAGTIGGGTGFYSIAGIDAQTAVVAFGPNSGDGKIWRTTNGGTNWNQVYTTAGAWFNFVDNLTNSLLWAQSDPVGGNFLILKSTDGGATWATAPNPIPATFAGANNSFYRIGNKVWFGTSSSNRVYYSNNGPDGPWSFSTASANNVGTVAFNGVSGNGLAAFWSNSTTINRSADGGATWTTQAAAIGTPNFFDYVVGTNRAWAATSSGIWRTTDNGGTWSQDVNLSTGFNHLKFYNDANLGVAVGNGGKIFRSTMQAVIPNFLTHNTGNMQATFFKDGYIGHDYNGAIGGGVVVGSNPDAMYTAGIIIGAPTTGVTGMVGSFTSATGQPPIIADNVSQYGMFGFNSNAVFNQVALAGFKDELAPAPYGLNVHQESFSAQGDKFVFVRYRVANNTLTPKNNLRIGIFADWDVGLNNYAQNSGGVDVQRNMVYQYLNMTTPNDPNYYGIVAVNGMTGAKLSSVFPGSNETIRQEILGYISAIDNAPITVNGDYRTYIGSGPFNIAAGQEVWVVFALVYGSNLTDLQANATAAFQKGLQLVPVELSSFIASVSGNNVNLSWITASETNNHRFEVERKVLDIDGQDWVTIGFRQGMGTSAQENKYSFVDDLSSLNVKKVAYRLKQVDFDGTYAYSDEIELDVNTVPESFGLTQNYPNPFNPSTSIRYNIPQDNFVSLKVYNTLGEEVATLVNSFIQAGSYEVNFDAKNLTSGIYYYVVRVGDGEFVKTMKMLLLK